MLKKTSSKKPRLDSGNRHRQRTNKRTSTPQAPIAKLSDDVLFYIFSMNSRMEMMPFNKECSVMAEMYYEEDTLPTNRYSSGVCRRWRNIILSSPTIWANTLHIDELNQRGDDWRDEVLARTGNAPISLVGSIGFESSTEGIRAIPFVLDLLENQWDRIRYFSICTNELEIEDEMVYLLERPAPNLEYFLYRTSMIDKDEEPHRLYSQDGEVFLSNLSHKLTFICCQGINFDFGPGVSNLRCLWLTGYRASFTIPEMFLALQHLPLLEELFIDHDDLRESVGLGNRTPRLTLPRLADIAIHHSGTELITDLVGHIVPARGCRLVVSDTRWKSLDELTAADLANLSQAYSTFIRNTADFHPVQYLSLSYTQTDGFTFRAGNGPHFVRGYHLAQRYPYLKFSYSARSEPDLPNLNAFSVPVMKALASRPDLGKITKLDLRFDDNTLASSHAEALAIVRQLESVVELTSDIPTIQALVDLQATSDLSLLPRTTTVTVTRTFHHRTDIRSPTDSMDAFLKGRVDRGIPVHKLRLLQSDFEGDGRWDFLHKIDGLSVVWRGLYPDDE